MLGLSVGLVQRPGIPQPLIDADLVGTASLPDGLVHDRPSQAWDYGFASYAIDAPRLTASGLLYEEARTNTFSYSKLNDAAVQSTEQFLGASVRVDGPSSGMTVEVSAVGTENGVPHLDYRISGTRTGVGDRFFDVIETLELAGVSEADPDTVTLWLKLAAGSVPASVALVAYRHYRDLANAIVSSGGDPITIDGSLVRYSSQRSAPATTTRIVNRGFLVVVADTAAGVDFTVRVGAIQHEQNAIASSPIVTTGSQITRAADTLTMILADGQYDVLVERADLDGAVTKTFVDATASGGAGWDVPIDMARPYLRRLRAWPDGQLSAAQKGVLSQ